MQDQFRIGWRGEQVRLARREEMFRWLGFFGLCLTTAGLVTSPGLMSIGIGLFTVSALCILPPGEHLRRFLRNPPAMLFSLLLLLQIVSGIWTREIRAEVWQEEVIIKLPLLAGMYAWAALGPFSVKQVRIVLLILLLSTCFVGSGTLMEYIFNAEEMNHRVEISKEIEVWLGCNHIYFSVVMAFSILGGMWSLMQEGYLIHRHERWVVIAILLLCFFEMHVLTTRTGLVGLYLCILILGWFQLIKRKKILLAVLLAVALASMPVIGYYGIDSFQKRVENTKMDVTEYFQGKDPNYLSIGSRIESWKTAYHLWQKHPVLGVGMADLLPDMTDQYVEDGTKLCPENFLQPHNQFLQMAAGCGILGVTILLLAWFYPLVVRGWPKDLIFWAFWLNYSLAMMGESMMERQVGVSFLVVGFMLTLGVGRVKQAATN
ncbi:MAG: O-antigen ligase family protein [Bacteroidia bacterium]